MIKFCPMCGSKVIADSKFCNGCGLNLTEYQQKLDKLMKNSPTQIKSTGTGNTNENIVPPKTENSPVHSEQDDNTAFNMQKYIRSLNKDYDYLDNVYFNLQREKNQRKISAAQKAYATATKDENIIFVFDNTFFGAADDGFLVTNKKIYVHNGDGEPFNISHAEIKSYSFEKYFFGQRVIGQKIILNNDKKITLTSYKEPQTKSLIALLKKIQATFCGQVSVAPKKNSLLHREEKTPPAQPISQETPRGVELTEEFAYYTPPPPFTPPPPKNFLGKPYIIKNETECRTKDQKYMLESFKQAIHDLTTHEYDDFPTIKSDIQKSALSSISVAAMHGYIPAIYLNGHIFYDGYFWEKNWIEAKIHFEKFAVYGEDEDDKGSQRLIALGRFSTIMRHHYPKMRIDILKPEVFHYYLRELLETSLAANYPLKCVYFNTTHCDRKTLKKINSALEVYVGQLKEFEFPLIVFDPTTFGSAIEGCLFSNFGIYIRNSDEKTTHFVDYESYETKDITIRGLILKDVYVGEQKIEISSCGYGDSERTTFAYIVRDMGGVFGKR